MFKSRGAGLEPRICFSAEKAALRHQVVVLRRIVHGISLPLLCASSSTARLVCTESPIRIDWGRRNDLRRRTMIVLLCFVLAVLVSPFKSKNRTIPPSLFTTADTVIE